MNSSGPKCTLGVTDTDERKSVCTRGDNEQTLLLDGHTLPATAAGGAIEVTRVAHNGGGRRETSRGVAIPGPVGDRGRALDLEVQPQVSVL